jgi:hypothetical protein
VITTLPIGGLFDVHNAIASLIFDSGITRSIFGWQYFSSRHSTILLIIFSIVSGSSFINPPNHTPTDKDSEIKSLVGNYYKPEIVICSRNKLSQFSVGAWFDENPVSTIWPPGLILRAINTDKTGHKLTISLPNRRNGRQPYQCKYQRRVHRLVYGSLLANFHRWILLLRVRLQ